MSDLIDRQALKDYVSSLSTHPLNEWDTWGVLAAIDKQPTIAGSPWHRVEEELPKYGEYVLAWEIQGFAVIDKYVRIGDGRWDLENEGAIYTHWMPLPEPPKEEEHGN